MHEVVDLFAGPGGWDLAAELLGLDVLGIEFDHAAVQTRKAAGFCTLEADVAALDPLDFAGLVGLIASPPCQAWSRAGNRAGIVDQEHVAAAAQAMLAGVDLREKLRPRLQDERSMLVLEPLRWALALKPRWIALEQVPDVLPLWRMFASALAGRGYSTWAGKLNAADYGVPQTRERAFMVATLDRTTAAPEPSHADPRKATGCLFGRVPWVSMGEALGWGLSEAPAGTIVSVSPSGGPRSGALDGGSGSRRRYQRERAAGRWIEAPPVELVNGNQDRATVRALDEPASTIAFGHAGSAVRWRVRTQQSKDGWEQQRDSDLPAPTVVGSRRAWLRDPIAFSGIRSTGNTKGGTRPDGLERPAELPAHTLTGRGDQMRKLRAGTNENDVERDMSEPAPTLRFGARLNTVAWVDERPATTLQGDPRIAQPGHKRDKDFPDSPGRMEGSIRVSLAEAAILQSFPPDFPWQGNKTKCYQQIGNAVPPLLALRVLETAT